MIPKRGRGRERERERHFHIVVFSLSMTDESISNAIFKAVHKTLRNSSYQFKNADARIITGEEEAIGGWTTTNYLDKNLNPPKVSERADEILSVISILIFIKNNKRMTNCELVSGI